MTKRAAVYIACGLPTGSKRNVIFRYDEYALNMNDLCEEYKDFCQAPAIKQK
jgi:hypothetical protein